MIDLSKTIFITMDLDWACDEVIEDSLNLIDDAGIPVTIFVTHQTSLLERMRKNSLIRLGIHPNFYPQLNNNAKGDYLQEIERLLSLVPEAHCARSHGLVDATPILSAFEQRGITHDLNLFIPFSSGIQLKPFRHFSGLKRIPFFYEDDAACFEPVLAAPADHLFSSPEGLKVFNFHPIHLFLNTESMERYYDAKPFQHNPECLLNYRNQSVERGARSFLKELVCTARAHGIDFAHVEDL